MRNIFKNYSQSKKPHLFQPRYFFALFKFFPHFKILQGPKLLCTHTHTPLCGQERKKNFQLHIRPRRPTSLEETMQNVVWLWNGINNRSFFAYVGVEKWQNNGKRRIQKIILNTQQIYIKFIISSSSIVFYIQNYLKGIS